MDQDQINTLWNAIIAFILTVIENGLLYSILFYSVFKTVISIDNDSENEKWLKYWIIYGFTSFICYYIPYGIIIKICISSILLVKFNDYVILNSLYDIVLSNIIKSSRGYLEAFLNEIAYRLYCIIESIHWIFLNTFNMSESMIEKSEDSLEATKQILRKNEQKYWIRSGNVISNNIRNSHKNETLFETVAHPTYSLDNEDETYNRLSQTCIFEHENEIKVHSMDESFDQNEEIHKRR